MTDIGETELDLQIISVIKSNLITLGLTSEQIEKTSIQIAQDVSDILCNYGYYCSKSEEE